MKRKTNLFYTTGPDSKFITFSNYAESLTGNFLSTDTKIFPSRFIALYLKGLNKETKPALIKYLADYYESKLAVLRDYFNYNKGDIEKSVPPLNYLLEALLRIRGFEAVDDGSENISYTVKYNHSISYQLKDSEPGEYEIIPNTAYVQMNYISDITEQDYNGTFTDTICNIDLRRYAYVSGIVLNSDDTLKNNVVQFDMPTNLYGWDGDIPSEYINERTIPDSVQGINLDEYMSSTTNYSSDNNSNNGGSIIGPHHTPNNSQDNGQDNGQVINPHINDNADTAAVQYKINDNLNNVIDLNNKQIEFNGDTVSVKDIINETMTDPANNVNTYEEALNSIIHQNSNVSESLRNFINEKLADARDGKIYFYSETAVNVIYMYDGADFYTIDMTKNNEYFVNPEISMLQIHTSNNNSLEFNCIIPLYDIVDINYKSNFNTIERIISTNGYGEIDMTPSETNKMYCTNVPLGMWIYTEGDKNSEDTTSVKLYKDTESGFSQSWSLTIASQFKPFPYSSKMPSELTTNSNTNAYATFAQVLASQSSMIDNFNKLNATIATMNEHIRNMESQLANLGTSYNIDNIHREFNNFEIAMNNKFTILKDDVINQLSYLKWRTTI